MKGFFCVLIYFLLLEDILGGIFGVVCMWELGGRVLGDESKGGVFFRRLGVLGGSEDCG